MAFNAKAAARYVGTAAVVVTSAGIVAAATTAHHPAARSTARPAAHSTAHPGAGQPGSVPPPQGERPASVNPRGAFGRILSAAQASSSAQACAGYATYAGWANTAQNGALVTASAICVAESGGQPTVYYCNPTGQDGYYPPVSCSGLYDRGLWQIDSQAWATITDACAFTARCNADAAYGISQSGSNFTPWATYTSGVYANYLSEAQSAVTTLRTGTVASGVVGVCLSRAKYAQDAPAITANCGNGTKEQWGISGTVIRDGIYCLAVASRASAANVWLRRCDGLAWQQWAPQGNGELRNVLSGRCLHDPGGTLTPGTQVTVGYCATVKARTWWLP
ncbi:MAG TPA: ricin-type beta-trefoil lectin domain protein [Streptosporangiaceae bacterium]|nr:ricin-type beta-trefoil lectin domain protein [Streptosporangiaceae bacterium]